MMTAPTPVADPAHAGPSHMGGKGQRWLFPPISHAPSSYGVKPTWTRRPTIAANKPQKSECPYLQPCLEWLRSSHAMASAVELLKQNRLDVKAKDVVDDVTTKIWMRLTKNPDTQIDNIRGYCYMAIHHHIVDMLSGWERKDVDLDGLADDDDPLEPILGHVDSDNTAADDDIDIYDRLRAHVESSGKKPKVISTALAYLVMRHFDDVDTSGLKAPEAGARPDQALWWPCLWLAEHDERMFPPEKKRVRKGAPTSAEIKAGNAQRRARNYAVKRARDLLLAGPLYVKAQQ